MTFFARDKHVNVLIGSAKYTEGHECQYDVHCPFIHCVRMEALAKPDSFDEVELVGFEPVGFEPVRVDSACSAVFALHDTVLLFHSEESNIDLLVLFID